MQLIICEQEKGKTKAIQTFKKMCPNSAHLSLTIFTHLFLMANVIKTTLVAETVITFPKKNNLERKIHQGKFQSSVIANFLINVKMQDKIKI